jgi:hypothetical protein
MTGSEGRERIQYSNRRELQYPTFKVDRLPKQKTHKKMLDLDHTLDDTALTDFYRTF